MARALLDDKERYSVTFMSTSSCQYMTSSMILCLFDRKASSTVHMRVMMEDRQEGK
ncbi:hypothetical protein K469DRAFT_714634 [Zopfia rhizophila CBS 207.26]|uniref:Uncharacterized protein n=1 Tax=Zopfia rhizophila CBS 207.26 TaxID=1314779 RepID=A0A6A6DR06_9PEZI|nr:hypothetical protein K469DRAFT_714634 [Zopfia rhizophila CBS 207.26]